MIFSLILAKLKLMVDRAVPSRNSCIVVKDSGREFNANLLCVEGIHNKYYIMQILKKNRESGYFLYRRWGRCGTDGQAVQTQYDTLDEAVDDFDVLLNKKLEEYSEVMVNYG